MTNIMFDQAILFPETLNKACWAGSKIAHATGLDMYWINGSTTVQLGSINTTGRVTTDCKIPLPANSITVRAVADSLLELANLLEEHGK